MTATEISNVGAGIAALAIIFWSYMAFVKSLKPLIERLDEVIRNNTQAVTASKDASDNVAKALQLLEISFKNQTEIYITRFEAHDNRSAEIHEEIREVKRLASDIKSKICE